MIYNDDFKALDNEEGEDKKEILPKVDKPEEKTEFSDEELEKYNLTEEQKEEVKLGLKKPWDFEDED